VWHWALLLLPQLLLLLRLRLWLLPSP